MRAIRSFFWFAASCAVVGVLGGLLIGWLITLTRPEIFTASSSLRVVPSKVPARFVPAMSDLTVEAVTEKIIQDLDSAGLSATLQAEGGLDLERASMPREDYLKLLRQRIEIRAGANHTLVLSNSDEDRQRALKMNHALVSHVMSQMVRQSGGDGRIAADFLRERADSAAAHWEALDAQLRKATGSTAARLRLELNVADRQYEEIVRMAGEAKTLAEMQSRGLGPTVEVVELSNVPESPTNESHRTIYVAGVVAGALAGLLVAVATRIRFV